jgi:hypothetical protein
VKDYASKIRKKTETVARWGSHITRSRLKILIGDLPVDDQRYVMKESGHYLDPKHITEELKGTSDPVTFIEAFKDVFDLTDNDFGVGHGTIDKQRQRDGDTLLRSLVKQFVTVEKSHVPQAFKSQMKECWNAYKQVCARHEGRIDGSQASDLFMRQMEEERARQIGRGAA